MLGRQNKRTIILSASVPLIILVFSFLFKDFEVLGFLTFIYMYVIAPIITRKYGYKIAKLKLIDKTSKKKSKKIVFLLWDKLFTAKELKQVKKNISSLLVKTIVVGLILHLIVSDVGDFFNNPLEFIPFIVPYWALHLYCWKTDTVLSIIQLFNFQSTSYNKMFDQTGHSPIIPPSISDKHCPVNIQGKPSIGNRYLTY